MHICRQELFGALFALSQIKLNQIISENEGEGEGEILKQSKKER